MCVATIVQVATGGGPAVQAADPLPAVEPLADINTRGFDSTSEDFARLGDLILFVADDGETGAELWSHDLDAGTTKLVTDLRPGESSAFPSGLTVFEGEVYFRANDGVSGSELWRTDGTKAGTHQVADIAAGAGSSTPSGLVGFDGELYFRASDGSVDGALWRTVGNTGAELVADINPTGSDVINYLSVVSVDPELDALYFAATDGVNAVDLFRYDSKAGLTAYDAVAATDSSLLGFEVVDAVLYLRRREGSSYDLVRVSGGLAASVTIDELTLPDRVNDLEAADGRLFVEVRSGSFNDLYVVDGPTLNPVMILDDAQVDGMAGFGAGVLFRGDGPNGQELWYSGGTTGTMSELADLEAGPADSVPHSFEVNDVGGVAVFATAVGSSADHL